MKDTQKRPGAQMVRSTDAKPKDYIKGKRTPPGEEIPAQRIDGKTSPKRMDRAGYKRGGAVKKGSTTVNIVMPQSGAGGPPPAMPVPVPAGGPPPGAMMARPPMAGPPPGGPPMMPPGAGPGGPPMPPPGMPMRKTGGRVTMAGAGGGLARLHGQKTGQKG